MKQGLPLAGYHVCTLHQLAPASSASKPNRRASAILVVIDESRLRRSRQVVEGWIAAHRPWWESFCRWRHPAARAGRSVGSRKPKVGRQITRHCSTCAPDQTRRASNRRPAPSPRVPAAGPEPYAGIQPRPAGRRALDFDDLLWQALDALQHEGLVTALRQRWPYLLEDEAQASSPLQEQLLQKLVGDQGNWVRLGHPYQAIYRNFTTADPLQFTQFCEQQDVLEMAMPGTRSVAPSLLTLSNSLVQWASEQHPEEAVRPLAFLTPSRPALDWVEPDWPTDAESMHVAARLCRRGDRSRLCGYLGGGLFAAAPEPYGGHPLPGPMAGHAVVEARAMPRRFPTTI